MDDITTLCIATALRRAAATVTDRYNRHLTGSGLNVMMMRLLHLVETHPGATITELARLNGLERTTVGRNIRVLERRGMVGLGPGQDDRSRGVSLTKKGQNALDTARPLWREMQDALAKELGADKETLLALLNKIHT